jgi:two-component system, sensor histidine kinase and response regulator
LNQNKSDDVSPHVDEDTCILVVDDVEDNVFLLKVLLEAKKYHVEHSYSGEEALKKLENGLRPDLILLDIMMPGIDGYEACSRIHQIPDMQDIPIIMLTAKRELESKIRGLECGAYDYITKPFNQEEVLARVNSLLTIRRLQKQLLRTEKRATVGEMMITINHEINNPLSAVLGNTELLMMELTDVSDRARRKLETIYAEAMRIRDILKRINNLRVVESTRYLDDLSMINLEKSEEAGDQVDNSQKP